MKKITYKTIKMTASFILLLCATFKADAQTFTTGSQAGGTGDGHYLVTTKDFNGDGYDDIASNDGNNNMRIILSNGSGGFNAATALASGVWAYEAEDLDNDGDIDIAVTSSSQNSTPGFYIYKNNGSGSFTLQSATPTNITFSGYAVGGNSPDVVVFDANGDGKKDILLMPNIYSPSNSFTYQTKYFLFTNTSSGGTISFSQTAVITSSETCGHGISGDVDNDGDQDLILDGNNGTFVFKNNGSGSFTYTSSVGGYNGNQFFYDWNKDGYLDIMVMDDYNGYGLRYKLNDGTGGFSSNGVQLIGTSNNSQANGLGFLADMNGDGLVDAVYRGTDLIGTRGYIHIYLNTGCGFSATPSITSAQLTNDVTINIAKIDANKDGKPDVFVMGGGTNKTFLNNIATATAPVVSTIIGVTNASRCGNGTVNLKAGASNSGTIKWWDAASGGNQVTTGNNYNASVSSSITTASYWVDASLNGCTSSRVKVVGTYKGIATSSTSNVTACSSQLPYSWNGQNYNAAGTYTATLTNSVGCDSVATLNLSVGNPVTPSVAISTANANICDNANATFTATATNGGVSPVYEWYKNGVNAGTGSSITFLAGTLSTNDVIGCVLTANNACQTTAIAGSNKISVTIFASPQVGVSTALGTACTIGATTTVYNSNTNGGGVWVSSNTSVATVSTAIGASGLVTIVGNGTATIRYIKTDGTTGCRAAASSVLVVDAVTAPAAITGASNLCVGNTTTFTSSPSGGVWSSDNNRATINASTGLATGSNAGTATIKYTLTNASNCTATASYNVTVTAKPSVPSIAYATGTTNPQYGAPTGSWCTNRSFNVVGSPAGGVWSSTGVLTVNATSGAVSTGNTAGAASLTYTAGSAGCTNSRTITASIVGCGSRNSQPSTDNSQPWTDDSKLWTMYPNPAKSVVNLNIDKLIGAGNIVVTDLYGKQVKTQPLSIGTNTINISNLSKGFYLISTITTEGKTTKKLVVE